MDRRDTIKSLLLTSLGGGMLVQSCKNEETSVPVELPEVENKAGVYGRTPEEKERDKKLMAEVCYNEHEISTVATLCDIILPASETAVSANEAGVPEFIEFISKDLPYHELPVKGGIMWLDNFTNKLFDKEFKACTAEEQIEVVDQIAYPGKTAPELLAGEKFFTRMRNLVLTGYYTSEPGIKDLGYKGNMPNVWDGIPDEVLKEHGLEYEKEWIPKFVDQSKRDVQAEWDEEGNLIT